MSDPETRDRVPIAYGTPISQQRRPQPMYGHPIGYSTNLQRPPRPQLEIEDFNEREQEILAYARGVMWFSLLDCLFCMFFALGGLYFLVLLLLLPLPIIGFYGGKMLNKCFCITYMVYTVLQIAIRVVIMVFFPIPLILMMFGLAILVELIIIRYTYSFCKIISTVDEDERESLKEHTTLGCE